MALEQILEWEWNYGYKDYLQSQYLNHPGKTNNNKIINKVKQGIAEVKLDYIWQTKKIIKNLDYKFTMEVKSIMTSVLVKVSTRFAV